MKRFIRKLKILVDTIATVDVLATASIVFFVDGDI